MVKNLYINDDLLLENHSVGDQENRAPVLYIYNAPQIKDILKI